MERSVIPVSIETEVKEEKQCEMVEVPIRDVIERSEERKEVERENESINVYNFLMSVMLNIMWVGIYIGTIIFMFVFMATCGPVVPYLMYRCDKIKIKTENEKKNMFWLGIFSSIIMICFWSYIFYRFE